MRFAMRSERWWMNVLVSSVALSGLAFAAMSASSRGVLIRAADWTGWAQIVCSLILTASSFRGYCEVRENHLFFRRGWGKIAIPYSSLVEFKARRRTHTDRVLP